MTRPDGRRLARVPLTAVVMACAATAAGCGDATGPGVGATQLSFLGTTWVRHGYAFANTDLFLVNMDGTGLAPLTQTPGHESAPAWAPDGRRVAYLRDGRVRVLDVAAGTESTLAPDSAIAWGLAWSPDGTRLALVRDGAIAVVTVGTGALQPVSAEDAVALAWSPDGAWLLASSYGGVRLVRADGGAERPVTDSSGLWTQGAWSPAGSQLVLTRVTGSYGVDLAITLWIVDAATGALVRTLGNGECAAWSPDGARIAFLTADGNGNAQVAVIGADGSGRLTTPADLQGDCPQWSPDGSRIAVPLYQEVLVVGVGATLAPGTSIPTAVGAQARWRPAPR